jgi:hypothetical protein
MAAAVESGSLSDKDLVIASGTLEELGLLKVQDVRERWEAAVKASEDQRARNIAKNVKNQATKEKLEEGADAAVQKTVEEVVRGLRVYFVIDVSASMNTAIAAAMSHIEKFIHSVPLEQLHVCLFNTAGRIIEIKHRSSAGVRQAFRGKGAGGGTDYAAGVLAFQRAGLLPKEDEDVLMVFVGDELNHNRHDTPFDAAVRQSGLRPMAFGLVRVGNRLGVAVQSTAARLEIPCFQIDERTFDDVYAVPRIIRGIVAATPVGKVAGGVQRAPRVTLVDTILKTDLLQKPVWATV